MQLDAENELIGAEEFRHLGRLQDTQRFNKGPAVLRMVELGAFDQSEDVFELGCGTRRLVSELLDTALPQLARRLEVDVSETMVRLATNTLEPQRERTLVQLLAPPAVEFNLRNQRDSAHGDSTPNELAQAGTSRQIRQLQAA